METAAQTTGMKVRKPNNIFVQGPVTAAFIADSIQKHSNKTDIGGHSIFLGQVRADKIDGKEVACIEYTAYEEMALEKMHAIREDIFQKYELTCMHVYHSLGKVAAGEISLFVFTSSAHRKAAIDACEETVERIKVELPVWGKELFADETYQWKENPQTP
jgi:molybdopterin synthase catalytic subunit